MTIADLIIHSGNLFTLDSENPAQAIAIKDGKFVGVGSVSEIMSFCDVKTEVINAKGCSVFPGLRDSHIHLMGYGVALMEVSLEGCKSIIEMTERIITFKKEKNIKDGQWIRGRGWNQNLFNEKRFPTKLDLDSIAPNPMFFMRVCGHGAVVNSMGLKLLGIDNNSPSPEGGEFHKENGELTGLIFGESALTAVRNSFPRHSLEEYKNIVKHATDSFLSKGLTEVHTEDMGNCPDIDTFVRTYLELASEDKLPIRVSLEFLVATVSNLENVLQKIPKYNHLNERIQMNIIKILSDGSLGARTAAMVDDYNDASGNNGRLYLPECELFNIVELAHKTGNKLGIHAIGDRSAEAALRAIENAQNKYGYNDNRHRLIHCQFMNPTLWEKMAKLKVLGDIQPRFLTSDWAIVKERVGEARAKTAYAWKSMMKHGIVVSGGSDCPVEPPDPLLGMYAAITRADLEGNPCGELGNDENFTPEEALKLFTTNVAYSAHGEQNRGIIKVGQDADLTIVEGDYSKEPAAVCKNNKIKYTICNGKVCYENL